MNLKYAENKIKNGTVIPCNLKNLILRKCDEEDDDERSYLFNF